MEAKPAPPPVDRLIADLADAQHGVIALDQLTAIGLGRHAIQQRVRRGRLHRVYRGVYAVGRRRIQREGWWMAATLSTDGVLSHRSAAALWALATPVEQDEVTIATSAGRGERRGLTIHRTSSLPSTETTTRDGIPTTTVARTLLDLAEVVTRRRLERALDESEFRRLFDEEALRAVVASHPGRVGAKRARGAQRGHYPSQ
jgi:predicted transcriptional regulator of viral defense system